MEQGDFVFIKGTFACKALITMSNFYEKEEDTLYEWQLITIPKRYKTNLKGKKIRLLVDENIPIVFVSILKETMPFSIATVFEHTINGKSDIELRTFAKNKQLILLTTDKDFWNEKMHPTANCYGIFCFECGPQDLIKMVDSYLFFYTHFLYGSSNDFWMNKKILIKINNFSVRALNYNHQLLEYEFKLESSKIYRRRVK